jgi:predicted dehydrogenase
MTESGRPLRFGLVGTGHWARVTHAPALASTDGIEFAAVWGRNPEAAEALAAAHGAAAYAELGAFFAAVDAVAFSVPPDVQAAIAARAAGAGKHLLLEKPVATSLAAADALAEAAAQARVASVVFFTARFQAEVRAWLAEVAGQDGWLGGFAVWLGTAWRDDSPFNTAWRGEKGGLWDLGPHAVSMLWACLGPVVAVTADAGRNDVTHLVLHHRSGATSTVTVTLDAPAGAEQLELSLWGAPGRWAAPAALHPVPALRVALAELAANARSGRLDHPCDVRFGRDVVRVLAEAQDQLTARGTRSRGRGAYPVTRQPR